MICGIEIDGERHSYEIDGTFGWGKGGVLFLQNADTLQDARWYAEGYTVVRLFSDNEMHSIRSRVQNALSAIINRTAGGDASGLILEKYHHVVDDETHNRVIAKTRVLDYESLGIDIKKVCDVISSTLGKRVTSVHEDPLGNVVILRISRPDKPDINPPHRDAYQKVWERTINVWIPVAGCEQQSSLPIIPGSHLWNEANVCRTDIGGAKIGANRYHVPAIIETRPAMRFVRPNPKDGEALVFTPYLIHGSAINQLADITRMSLELRLPVV